MQLVLKNKVVLKISAISISCAVLFTSFPTLIFAQTTSGQITTLEETVVTANKTSSNQATAFTSGSTSGGNTSGAKSVVSTSGSCLASTILSTSISSTITSAINSLGTVGEKITNMFDSVKVNNPTHEDKTEAQKQKEVGPTVPYTNVLIGVGWDGIAWCIANSLIEYVAESTIAWANSGFNGSPSFVSNTDSFFENLADQEAGNFINSIAKSVTNGGVNLCSNFKVSISIGLSNYYSKSSYSKTSSCTLTKIVSNVDSFMEGNFEEGGWEGWFSMTQNASNNKIGATILATDELYGRLSVKNNTAKLELGLNNGFLNYKKCEKKSDGTVNEKSCKTVTPGTVIQSSLEKSLNLSKDRLVAVQKFDQVIEAVVNNLIKVALNEVLTTDDDDD